MKINIYTSLNGVGLEKDYLLLKGIFESAGHEVQCADWMHKNKWPSRGDIAIHLEIPRPDLTGLARVNIMVPNPEWFEPRWIPLLKRFDHIWAKTKDCQTIFSKYHKSVIYTSFTSVDFYRPEISKDMQCLHVQGKSGFKGTNEILQAYAKYELPKLYLLSKHHHADTDNVVCGGFLSAEQFQILLNSCLIHLCPSYYEGFGHYLWEAMSCGAVVITTNAAPMNAIVTDPRLLVDVAHKGYQHFGVLSYPSVVSIKDTIKSVSEMDTSELQSIGRSNREKFLENDKQFKKTVLELCKAL